MTALPGYGRARLRSGEGTATFTPLVAAPGASVAVVHQPVSTIAAPPLPDHVVCVSLSPIVGYEVVWDGRLRTGRFRRGDVAVLPSGFATEWAMHARQDVLHLHVSPDLLAAQDERTVDLVPALNRRSPALEELALRLLREEPFATTGDLACALLLALRCEAEAEHGLGPLRRRAVEDFVCAGLAGSIAVGDLAALAGLSPYHFSRAFTREFGETPHRWLVERRLARAERLLRESGAPIADIALACGFVDQAHLTRAYRGRRGTTPGAVRRASTARGL